MNRTERRARERQQARELARSFRGSSNPKSAKGALELAQQLFRQGKAKDALPGLRQAVMAFPDDADLRGALGYAMAAIGQVMPAIEQYRFLVAKKPDSAPALTNLAILLAKTGRPDEALEHLERAAALAPEHANTTFALAELLSRLKRTEEAFPKYRRAAVLFERKIGPEPRVEHADDLVKLASALLWMGDIGPALNSLDMAVKVRPNHALAHARRGLLLAKVRKTPEAMKALKRAAELEPNFAEARKALGDLLLAGGENEKAERYFAEAMRIDPNDQLSGYFLSAARHETPDAPPPSYVTGLFDAYAQTFEQHLVDVLKYRAPEQVCSALLELAGPAATDWSVIDLGCGTGLCGPLIRRAARYLVGVDLSVSMLDKARAKGIYDQLKLGDVAAVLGEYRDAFDLALSTDVMIYVGNLDPLFAAAERALKRGAFFAFTTEIHDGEGFVLDQSGRYLHSRSYVESVAAAHGFTGAHFASFVARYEGEKPDIHNLFIVRRAA